MGFKRPLVRIQSLGPRKSFNHAGFAGWGIFFFSQKSQLGQQTGQQILRKFFTCTAYRLKGWSTMAAIQEKVKNGKIVSCKFKVCLGRDKSGKQVFKCMTWVPPEGLTPAKTRKAAQFEADAWEKELKHAFQQEQETTREKEANYTFNGFVTDVWMPIKITSFLLPQI